MDLQTRKLNLISYLAQIQDENILSKIEDFILQKKLPTQNSEQELKPFTVDELVARVQKSEDDFKNGRYKSQEDLEKISENW